MPRAVLPGSLAIPQLYGWQATETEALRRRASFESRSMQDVARQAVREYVESHSRVDLIEQVMDDELPPYAEALERLAR